MANKQENRGDFGQRLESELAQDCKQKVKIFYSPMTGRRDVGKSANELVRPVAIIAKQLIFAEVPILNFGGTK